MESTVISEQRLLSSTGRTATVSLFVNGLRNTALVQVVRLDLLSASAYSIYVVYREASMTFEASAKLSVAQKELSPSSLLLELLGDNDFMTVIFAPIRREVNSHFAGLRG